MHFIGIDIGTSSICGVIYNCWDERTESILVENKAGIDSTNPWEKLQDAEWILTSVVQMVENFESRYSDIKGIGVAGQMHGIVYVNNMGEAVSPLYTWQDSRGNLIINNHITYAEFLTDYSGYHLSTGYGLVTHFYNVKNAIVPDEAAKLCTIMDYVVMKLSGRKSPITDYSNAAGLGFFNIDECKFDTRVLSAIGIDASILPDVDASAVLAGHYNASIPVYAAIGDNQASFIASVKNRERELHVTIGTSSQLSVYSPDFYKVESLNIRPFPGGGFILVGAALSGGYSLSVLQSFFESVLALSNKEATIEDFYDIINNIDYQRDSETSLTVETLFAGTRSTPRAKGSISNISSTNFTAINLIHGFLRGICNEIYRFYAAIPSELKKGKDTLVVSGNAVKKNKLLTKLLKETFNFEIIKSDYEEDAAFGACIAAMVGGQYLSTFDITAKVKC